MGCRGVPPEVTEAQSGQGEDAAFRRCSRSVEDQNPSPRRSRGDVALGLADGAVPAGCFGLPRPRREKSPPVKVRVWAPGAAWCRASSPCRDQLRGGTGRPLRPGFRLGAPSWSPAWPWLACSDTPPPQ
ncbi:hypothetical protein NDU88_002619 [Pleurodeles waltl]|uniref:Uncharacterized protein n=1 Tax=Pleurodeles waltl TaxID=8319 RepID=A0AAV7PC68_PLEWA|nr:hypothetical protein NDU88_002619 [Pleurodeles waltl]